MNVSEQISWENLNGTDNGTSSTPGVFLDNDTQTDYDEAMAHIVKIKPFIDLLLLAALILTMTSMGVEINKDDLIYHIRRPIGVVIGMFSQFFMLPLSAFFFLRCLSIKGLYATGVLLMSCCPGGAVSNIFAYLCDGDLSLSVAMTTLSTLMAMGMMPLNLWMYGRVFATGELVIPYLKLAISLLCITSPVGVGMFLRWKFPRFATVFSKAGVIISIVIIIAYVIFDMVTLPNMFSSVPGELYAVVMSLPAIGFSLGYTLAFVFRQSTPVRTTIAIECGVQNVPTALAIITLSFPPMLQKEIIPIPYMYSLAMISTCLVFCCLYRAYKKCVGQEPVAEQLILEKPTTQKYITKQMSIESGITKSQEAGADEPMLRSSWKEFRSAFDFPAVHLSVL